MTNSLMRPWSQRCEYVASVAQRYPGVYEMLNEGIKHQGNAWIDKPDNKTRKTSVVDALTLMEEDHRAQQETV